MEKNKMAVVPLKKLFWKMELPMIISMVLPNIAVKLPALAVEI